MRLAFPPYYEAENALTLFPKLTGFTCGSANGRNILCQSFYAGGMSTDNLQDFDSRVDKL